MTELTPAHWRVLEAFGAHPVDEIHYPDVPASGSRILRDLEEEGLIMPWGDPLGDGWQLTAHGSEYLTQHRGIRPRRKNEGRP